ncbi:protein-glutamate methylesterase/protein-glutamine glutaminase [Bacillus sp. B-jedd]|uniref:protein-glutamate methylesterase/protein-glutamine glutaminase n=1 Tax=Bacillus sp. B-jedd TaxID=1476857 RepID=UPI00051571D0|nr:chemotaxis response regulator protein-glutamate methylesterase [Bacillus sp. B-jedd]CEG25880.1 response regulator receiver modulated CheB methylesterase [Bacillus sp. B-jedd]
MKQYGILVVDDSAFMRRAISQIIEQDSQFFVMAIARNGVEAVEKVQRLKPDLVTMDVEMPEMNGIIALSKIMKAAPVPVVMLSSRTGEGARETIQALEQGAVDFFLKDSLLKDQNGELKQEFLQRLKGILAGKLPSVNPEPVQHHVKEQKLSKQDKDVIIIGCSTGGPSALQTILPRFPKDFSLPVVVAQHMPQGFTKHLAERFNSLCNLTVKEAEDGEGVSAGTIYIAPSGFQTRFHRNPDGSIVFKVADEKGSKALYKPAIDITLSSAAPIFNKRLLSVILTGMGVDGTYGCGLVKKHGGTVLVEAEESCVVYGMPKSVYEAGHADSQYELSKIFQGILSFI